MMERERDAGEHGGAAIGAREIHAYGGLILVAIGGEVLLPGLGITAAGVALFYLGVWRMR